jgi:hypothetical protein
MIVFMLSAKLNGDLRAIVGQWTDCYWRLSLRPAAVDGGDEVHPAL